MNQQSTLIIIFIAVIAITAYMWSQGGENQAAVETNPEIQALEARLAELRHLKDLHFNTTVLQDQFFQSLAFPQIPPSPAIKIGRSNPFIPF